MEFTPLCTPQMNSVVDRKIVTMWDKAVLMLLLVELTSEHQGKLWPETDNTATKLDIAVPNQSVKISPDHMWYGDHPKNFAASDVNGLCWICYHLQQDAKAQKRSLSNVSQLDMLICIQVTHVKSISQMMFLSFYHAICFEQNGIGQVHQLLKSSACLLKASKLTWKMIRMVRKLQWTQWYFQKSLVKQEEWILQQVQNHDWPEDWQNSIHSTIQQPFLSRGRITKCSIL